MVPLWNELVYSSWLESWTQIVWFTAWSSSSEKEEQSLEQVFFGVAHQFSLDLSVAQCCCEGFCARTVPFAWSNEWASDLVHDDVFAAVLLD